MTDKLIIFDTTLRDGEQSPGASMTKEEKLRLARQLEKLGVDVIEAGFAAASPGDADAIKSIAQVVKHSTVCSLARANERDVRAAGEAIKPARSGRIHTFIATSPIHMEKKLRMSPDEVVERAVAAVKLAREYTDDVEFSAEDAVRSEMDFLVRVFDAVIRAGAKTINVPDTVGYSLPVLWGERFKQLLERVPGSDKVIWSTHCHNDLGMASANSLAAVMNGARQVECTINGLGERAGNCALEEVVMAVKTRGDYFKLGTTINTRKLLHTSRLVSRVTGIQVQRNKAVVGQNAFAHEAGIHQDGMLKERSTYEIMSPEEVGLARTELVLGKHSGRHALRERIRELGYRLDEEQLQKVFEAFKVLADRKKTVYDADIEALAEEQIQEQTPYQWSLETLHISAGTGTLPMAAVCMKHADGRQVCDAACGDGPIDAVFKTIERITEVSVQLRDYQVRSVTIGEDAQGEATVEVKHNGKSLQGRGISTDIIEASALAFLQVINRICQRQPLRLNPQTEQSMSAS